MTGIRAGSVIGGRWRIESSRATGEQGTVFRARDTSGGGAVAVKIVTPQTPDDLARLVREAEVLREIDHPAVVRYLDHGRLPNDSAFLVMEWVEGETLADRQASVGLDVAGAVAVARRIAEALAEVHRHCVVHRDLKPANVILRGGELQGAALCDFGVARRVGSARMTPTGYLVGTPPFMSPEQARGAREIDARSDVFALGCLLYEALTGVRPFRGGDLSAIQRKVLFHEPAPVAGLCPDCPPALAALVGRMLAKDPEARPSTAEEAGAALAALGSLPPGEPRKSRQASRVATEITRPDPGPAPDLLAFVILSVPAPETTLSPEALLAAAAAACPDAGGREVVDDGSLFVAWMVPPGESDRVVAAARALRAALPDAPIVLAAGPAAPGAGIPEDVLDRASHLLLQEIAEVFTRPPAEALGVRLDAAVTALVGDRFRLRPTAGGVHLI